MTTTTATARERLTLLEADYFEQPAWAQAKDLAEINRLRAELGMEAVDARLRLATTSAPGPAKPAGKRADHAEAEATYSEYLTKKVELLRHRDYAHRIAKATAGGGMTPVYPLACMGTGGGPLRCDVCGRPMILEGGSYQGVFADAAWARNPRADELWRSYISGGMTVRIAANGTLRIYHGYDGYAESCCAVGMAREVEPACPDPKLFVKVLKFLEHLMPGLTDAERQRDANEVLNTLANHAAGFGVNQPPGGDGG